jgi:hypothetical protein
MKATKLVLSTLVLCGLVSLASATVVQTNDSVAGTQTGFAVSATDLINSGQSSLGSESHNHGATWGSWGSLNDGVNAPGVANDKYDFVDHVYTLDTSVNTLGYTVTSIQTIAAWNDSRAKQNFYVGYKLVGDSTQYWVGGYTLYSNDEATGGDYTTRITLTDSSGIIVAGVQELLFKTGRYSYFTELDVIGSATIPEPATMSLLTLGGLGVLIRRKK